MCTDKVDTGRNTAEFYLDKIKTSLKHELPGRESQSKMMPVIHEKDLQYFNDYLKLKKAAVLILLFPEDNTIKTVFIERTPDPGPHSGQIAFPGGRKDKEDKDLIMTAIREAKEEIGVSINRTSIIGELTPIEIPVSGFSVLPVVAALDSKPVFNACEAEVKDIFTVDLIKLLKNKDYKTVPARGIKIETPCYIFDDTIVWGATAMVLSEFEDLVF